MQSVGDSITFSAIIAPIMSGIRTGNDGARVQLDVPESDMAAILHLITMRGARLKVTIELDDDKQYGGRLKDG